MKKIIISFCLVLLCATGFAQKSITISGVPLTIEGNLITTLQLVIDGKPNGTKELYSNVDPDLNILEVTEIDMDKTGRVYSVNIYKTNLKFVNKSFSFVTEKTFNTYNPKDIYVVQIGMQADKNVIVKSYTTTDTKPSITTEVVAQIYFTKKHDAEKYLQEIISKIE